MRRRRDDDGSMMLALLVIVFTAALGVLSLSVVVAEAGSTRHNGNFTQAGQVADAGLQAALYNANLLGSGHAPTISGFALPTHSTGSTTFTGAADGGGSYDVTLSYAHDATGAAYYKVAATGADSGVSRTVDEQLVPNPLFQVAVFATTSITLNGQNTVQAYRYAGTPGFSCSNGQVTSNCYTGDGYVGTNGSMDFRGHSTADQIDGVKLYNTANGATCTASGSSVCDNQPTGFPSATGMTTTTEDAWINAEIAACEAPGTPLPDWNSATNTPALHPGVNCLRSMTFSSSGPATSLQTTLQSVYANTSNDPSSVSCQSPNPQVVCVVLDPPSNGTGIEIQGDSGLGAWGNASALQIFVASTATTSIREDLGVQGSWTGAIWAPDSTCTSQGSMQGSIYGSMICNFVGNNNGNTTGNFSVYYDDNLTAVGTGAYNAKNFTEP